MQQGASRHEACWNAHGSMSNPKDEIKTEAYLIEGQRSPILRAFSSATGIFVSVAGVLHPERLGKWHRPGELL